MSARKDATDPEERARLEAMAFGPDVPPEKAARARARLDRLPGRPDGAMERSRVEPEPAAVQPAAVQPEPPRVEPARADPESVPDPEQLPADAEPHPQPQSQPQPPVPVAPALAGARAIRVAVGAAGVAVIAVAAFLGGLSTGAVTSTAKPRPTTSAASSGDDSAYGEAAPDSTLGDLLSAPQTYADQLPGDITAPVDLESTRLVFSNRSLEGDDAQTPWDVYAGVSVDSSSICLVATPDHITATEACYPKRAALTGDVALAAQASTEMLTIRLRDGIITGSVVPTH